MKWTAVDSTEKASHPVERILHRSTVRYLSNLLNFAMNKRKLEMYEQERIESPISLNKPQSLRKAEAHPSKRIRRDSMSRAELISIQRQLAMLSDGDGDRPIHVAVAKKDSKLVQKLCQLMVKSSMSLDVTNYLRQTPLHLAVMLGNSDIASLLLRFGASPLLSDRNGNSVFHLAVKSNNTSMMPVLLQSPQARNILNSMDYEGYSALHYAVLRNNPDAVKMLHNSEADMNKIDGKSGRTALVHAVLEQNTDMIDLLLRCGSCPEVGDYSGRSAIEMALQMGNVQIIKLLEKWIPTTEISSFKEQMTISMDKATKRTKTHN